MAAKLVSGLRWNVSLGAKFLRVVPFFTLVVVFLTLVSQIAALLASFLPLKVIIMLGSDGIPRYFPSSFATLDRDSLIAALSAGTLGFFLLHFLAERMIGWVTSLSTSQLLSRSQKMVLFENQEELAASSYQRYSRALAGGVFIVLSLFGLVWFYPWMFTVIIGYFFLVKVVFLLLYQLSNGFRERLESKLPQTLNLFGGVGFFVAFGFLVTDFIFWSPPGVIIAIVALLLSRQVMQRAAGMVGDLTSLRRQQVKLDALFFHGKVLLPQQVHPEKTLWPLLAPEARQAWVAAVLDELVGPEQGELDCHWQQLGTPNVVGLRAMRANRQYLVKLFEVNRSSWALHEATLMAGYPNNLSAPCWVGTTQLQKFHCLVYALPQGAGPEVRQVKEFVQQLQGDLLAAQLKHEDVKRYQRSRAMLWQRLEANLIERLSVAAETPDQRQDLANLLKQMAHLHQQLKALPVVLLNPEITQDAIWIPAAKGEERATPILLNWGRWSLEPVGAGWPEDEKQLANLGEALRLAAEQRAELSRVNVEQAELAALAFALERECNRQRYVQALELVPRMLERLAVLETDDQPGTANAG
ncbi:hypothetical protein HOP52_09780 [Halomonas campisalis]|uniref:Uncharacterized protein n=1 Tax=Billgrantia campisalis TaxID=74661 RepID=A0ABS9P8D2_9GAMM|nr:hypothetical protein [Halomonas campisalis]MCG6658043.1 hypothetical protein [Halomonas campisalis]MDR5862709.1 hypothetical protein [Halomonas campisalis]